MKITFLGTGDSFGSGGRFQACILVEPSGARMLLDCGASSLISMRREGIDPGTIDAVLVSHFHGDHFGGLPFLILDGQFAHRGRPLTIAGPPGIEERVRAAMEGLYPGSSSTPQPYPLAYAELVEGRATKVAGCEVTTVRVDHSPGAQGRGYRVACGGAVLAYSGDTAWTESLVELAAGADLFVCEANFFEKRVPYHMTYRALEAERERLRCGRILLTHVGPEMLAHEAESAIELARDGMVVELS
ncbi:MAG: MBL fold metallo-hydrolase [Candidatus Limnocylindria bacterium]